MEASVGNGTAPSDAELISRVRGGDRTAFGDLYGRHARAALALARQMSVSGAEADDLVAESFARVLDTLLGGRGPDSAFRAYLFTAIRHTAYDRTRKDRRLQFTDDITQHETAVEGDDPVLLQMENSFIAKAFRQLPERWQTILWHTQVEGQSPAEVGVLLGMSPNAVTSLAFRARGGLREAYLQVHMSETVAERCRTTIDRLGAYTHGGLSKREKAQVEAHLAECDRCPALAAELSEINSGLRGLLAPLLLGSGAAGYLATLPAVPVLTQVGATVVAGSSLAKVSIVARLGSKALRPALITGGVSAAAVAAVTAVVITLASSGSNPTADPLTTANPQRTSSASAVGTPSADNSAPVSNGSTTVPISSEPPTTSAPESAGNTLLPPPSGSNPVSPSGSVTSEVSSSSPPTTTPTALPTTAPTGTPTMASPTGSTTPTPQPTPTETPPTETPPTETPPPTPASITLAADGLINVGSLTAGSTQTLTFTATNSGGTAQPAGTITLAAAGVSLVAATATTQPVGLRAPLVAFAAAADALSCADNSCPLPAIEPLSSLTVAVSVQVTGTTARTTDLTWTVYDLTPITVLGVPLATGYAAVAVTAEGPILAGGNGQLALKAAVQDGVTDPGPLVLPLRLTDQLLIAQLPVGCTLVGTTAISCLLAAAGTVVDVVATPNAVTAQNLTGIVDAADRPVALIGAVTIAPRTVGTPLSMTGWLSGIAFGGDTIYCSNPLAPDRGGCGGVNNSAMVAEDPPISHTLDVSGKTVIWAELSWSTAGLTGDPDVVLNVDGAAAAVTGSPQPAAQDSSGRISAYTADVTDLVRAGGAISLTGLAASLRRVDDTTPFGAWTLVVAWSTAPDSPRQTLTYTNTNERSLPAPGQPPLISTLANSATPLVLAFITLWAPDPWGAKSLTMGGSKLPVTITGTRPGVVGLPGLQTGYDLISLSATELGELSGPLTLSNGSAPYRGQPRQDGIWLGPVLIIAAAG